MSPNSPFSLREEGVHLWKEYERALTSSAGNDGSLDGLSDSPVAESAQPSTRKRDSGSFRLYGSIGVLMLDVWSNQEPMFDERGLELSPGTPVHGHYPRPLLSKR